MSTLGASLSIDLVIPGSCWQLQQGVNGYARPIGKSLATQASAGRFFEVIELSLKGLGGSSPSRVRVRLLEDGYLCWLSLSDLLGQARQSVPSPTKMLNGKEIQERLPAVLDWVENASVIPNQYLWGGTLGPDFDCSGLIQAAFASVAIWIPRDAYQQESFCVPLNVDPYNHQLLLPGDLLFFGTSERCTHVALYRGSGLYWHSSGLKHGRNGIGSDGLDPVDRNPVACYYRRQMRGAGRVSRCHDGSTLD